MGPKPASMNSILPIYKAFFDYSRKTGFLPYKFDPDKLELTPISPGFFYCFFYFNALYTCMFITKAGFLFISNWATDLKYDTIKGGYFLQLLYMVCPPSVVSMYYSFGCDRKEFARVVSDCIGIESRLIGGNCKKYIFSYNY